MKKFTKLKTLFSKYVFQFDKINYFLSKKDVNSRCILCELSKETEDSLMICKSDFLVVSVNLYPYNSGHLMIFPIRHIEKYNELNKEEYYHLFELTKFFIEALNNIYKPSGFNIGMNLGENSGASIKHIHQHIIPRFHNELGMIDIIGGYKVIVESPIISQKKLIEYTKSNLKSLPFKIYLKN